MGPVCAGWLVGEAGRGLNAMFTMMNTERLFVGIQRLGITEAANKKATGYARERLQGRSSDGSRGPVAIIEHPSPPGILTRPPALSSLGRLV